MISELLRHQTYCGECCWMIVGGQNDAVSPVCLTNVGHPLVVGGQGNEKKTFTFCSSKEYLWKTIGVNIERLLFRERTG